MDQKANIITSVYFYILDNDVFKMSFYFYIFCLDFEISCHIGQMRCRSLNEPLGVDL